MVRSKEMQNFFADVDPVRRRIMTAVGRRDTKPELQVRSMLHRLGYRFVVDVRGLPGRPDLAFTRRKIAVFVHGCFWHSHEGCRLATKPRTRAAFWEAKLRRNVERDCENLAALAALGWQTHIVWQCSLRDDTWLHGLTATLGPPSLQRRSRKQPVGRQGKRKPVHATKRMVESHCTDPDSMAPDASRKP